MAVQHRAHLLIARPGCRRRSLGADQLAGELRQALGYDIDAVAPGLGALSLNALFQRLHGLAKLRQSDFEPFRGAPGAFGFGLQLALDVFVDELVGDERRLFGIRPR